MAVTQQDTLQCARKGRDEEDSKVFIALGILNLNLDRFDTQQDSDLIKCYQAPSLVVIMQSDTHVCYKY